MSPDSENPEISEKITRLQEKYFKLLPDKMAEIERVWRKFNIHSPEQFAVLEELYRHVHNLAGSAGTFGAESLSRTANELQQCLIPVLENEMHISQREVDIIEQLISRLKNSHNQDKDVHCKSCTNN